MSFQMDKTKDECQLYPEPEYEIDNTFSNRAQGCIYR
jgi:hypothetical protein